MSVWCGGNSRFGKYIKLQYDSQRHLIGAWTDHFLLEKSRLVHVDWEERNYHIYYQMLRGLPKEQLEVSPEQPPDAR